jgi:hypothetical protein
MPSSNVPRVDLPRDDLTARSNGVLGIEATDAAMTATPRFTNPTLV